MVFSSLTFLWIFLPFTLTANYLFSLIKRTDKTMLLLGDFYRADMLDMITGVFPNTLEEHYLQFDMDDDHMLLEDADVVVLVAVERFENKLLGEGGLLDEIIRYYHL